MKVFNESVAEFDFDEMVNEHGVEFLSEVYPDREPIPMDDIDEYLDRNSPMDIIRLSFNGERYGFEHDSFNPNDEYFAFNGYGNLISIPYLGLDDYLANEIDEVEFEEWCKEQGYIED